MESRKKFGGKGRQKKANILLSAGENTRDNHIFVLPECLPKHLENSDIAECLKSHSAKFNSWRQCCMVVGCQVRHPNAIMQPTWHLANIIGIEQFMSQSSFVLTQDFLRLHVECEF